MYLKYSRIAARLPVKVLSGKNAGKVAGNILIPDRGYPFYRVNKFYRYGSMYHKKEYLRFINLSVDIAEYLQKKSVQNVVALLYYGTDTFYVVIPLKDFIENSKVVEQDDKQYQVDWSKYPRIPYSQETLNEYG